MIVKDDVVEYVGIDSDPSVEAAATEGAAVVDLNQKTMAPGFIDGHMHLLMFGSSLQKISPDGFVLGNAGIANFVTLFGESALPGVLSVEAV